MPLEPVPLCLALGAALLMGLSKTGVPGGALPAVLLMTEAFAGTEKLSLGAMAPVLLVGDVMAVAYYHRHAQWDRLWGLLPAVVAGMVPAVVVLQLADDHVFKLILGWMVLGLLAVEGLRRRAGWLATGWLVAERSGAPAMPSSRATEDERQATPSATGPHPRPLSRDRERGESRAFALTTLTGLLAGFGTMLGNAAGPVMSIFLVGRGLDKRQFMGTWAWFFLIVNALKVPVLGGLGLLNVETLRFGLTVGPAVVAGALIGRRVFAVIPQRLFDVLALTFAAAAAIRMVLG